MTAPRSELSLQLRLAIPLAAQQAGTHLMGNVDAALLGQHDKVSLAAAGVGNNLLFAISCVGMGLVMGVDSIIPRALGAGRHADARRTLAAAIRISAVAGVILAAVCAVSPYALHFIGTEPQVANEAVLYTQLRSLGVLPFVVAVPLRAYLAARDVTRPLVVAVVAGNIVNFLLDLVLIFGVDAIGIPPLGVVGAALATTAVQLVTLGLYFVAVRSLDRGLPRERPRPADTREILTYGIPVAGQLFAEVGIFGVATLIAAHLGTIPAASHAIALNISSFTFALSLGIGAATNVRVGQAIGAGDLPLARRRGLMGVGLGLAVMSVCALGFVTAGAEIAGIYSSEADVIAATVPLLLIAAVFQLSDGTQAIAAGALRGLGRTRATFVANVIGHYVIGLAVTILLTFHFHLGAPGLWWGLSVGLTATAIFLVGWFARATRA